LERVFALTAPFCRMPLELRDQFNCDLIGLPHTANIKCGPLKEHMVIRNANGKERLMKDAVSEMPVATQSSEVSSRLLADSGAYACPANQPKEAVKIVANVAAETLLGAGIGSLGGLPEVGAAIGFGLGLYTSYRGEKAQYPHCVEK